MVPTPTSAVATTGLCSVSIVLPLLYICISGITKYIVSGVWFLSPSIMLWRLICVGECISSSLIFIGTLNGCTTTYLPIQQLMDFWSISSFLLLMNNAPKNIGVQVFGQTCVFISPGEYLGVKLLGHTLSVRFT